MADPAPDSVSAVVPCYNGERFLAETLDGLLAQTRPVCEVIVVDDGSTDGSAALAETFDGRNEVPVRVIRQENSGESVARNRAVSEAAGEWVGFCDADDLWRPEKLERLLDAAGPDDVAVHSDVQNFGSDDTRSRIADWPAGRYDLAALACRNAFVTPSAVLVRRSACPRFPEWTGVAEDLVFFLDLVRRGPVTFVPEPLIDYRKHPASQSAGPAAMLGWHDTVLEWLRRSPDLDPALAAGVRRRWAGQLVEAGRGLMRRGDWETFRRFQEHLETHAAGDDPDVAAFLAEPTRPRAFYRAQGRVDAARSGVARLRRAWRGRAGGTE